jgi:hypothetical protein
MPFGVGWVDPSDFNQGVSYVVYLPIEYPLISTTTTDLLPHHFNHPVINTSTQYIQTHTHISHTDTRTHTYTHFTHTHIHTHFTHAQACSRRLDQVEAAGPQGAPEEGEGEEEDGGGGKPVSAYYHFDSTCVCGWVQNCGLVGWVGWVGLGMGVSMRVMWRGAGGDTHTPHHTTHQPHPTHPTHTFTFLHTEAGSSPTSGTPMTWTASWRDWTQRRRRRRRGVGMGMGEGAVGAEGMGMAGAVGEGGG